MKNVLAGCLWLSWLFLKAAAETAFINPVPSGPEKKYDKNSIYRVGQRIPVQWRTDDGAIDLYVNVETPGEPGKKYTEYKLLSNSNTLNYSWTVSLDHFSTAKAAVNNGADAVLLFKLLKTDGSVFLKASHYFNVTDTVSTVSTATLIPTSSVSTPPQATSAPAQPSNSSEPAASSSNAGLIGGAVGGTIGGVLVLAGLGLFLWRHSRGKHDTSTEQDQGMNHQQDIESETKPWASNQLVPELEQPTSELPPHHMIHEAPGSVPGK